MLIESTSPKFSEQPRRTLAIRTISAFLPTGRICRFSTILLIVLASSLFLVLAGCKAGSEKFTKSSDKAAFDQTANKTGPKKMKTESVKLKTAKDQPKEQTKETIEAGRGDKGNFWSKRASTKANPVEPPVSPPPSLPKPTGELGKKTKHGAQRTKITEEEAIRQAALDIAKNIDTVKKIRICHIENEDEWWVTLYDDIGPVIDLKQYVWDRDSETLRPFLVLKRISHTRYEAQLTAKEPDRKCEVLDPPSKPTRKKGADSKNSKAL